MLDCIHLDVQKQLLHLLQLWLTRWVLGTKVPVIKMPLLPLELRHYWQDGEGLGWRKTSFMYYLCLGSLLFCQNLIDPKHHDRWKREEVRRKMRQKGSPIISPENIFHNRLLIFQVLHWKSLKQKCVNLLVWTELHLNLSNPKRWFFSLNRIAVSLMGDFSLNRTSIWISQTQPWVIFSCTNCTFPLESLKTQTSGC